MADPNVCNPITIVNTTTTYTVTASTGSSTCTATATVHVFPSVTPIIQTSHDTVFVFPDPLYASYQWSENGVADPGDTNNYHVIDTCKSLNLGLAITDTNGCGIAMGLQTLGNILCLQGVNEIYAGKIKNYPNPVLNELKILNPEFAIETIEIYNTFGQQCLQSEIPNPPSSISLDVSGLPSGVYILQLKTEKGIVVKKFVKE